MRIRLVVVCAVICCCFVSLVCAADVAALKAKAESGDVKAQVALAQAYEKGEGVAQNDELAAKWFRAAADQGDAQAQNELGILYRRGIGVPQDKGQAFEWYARSAAQGYGPGRFNLATCYYNGDGVGISDVLAYSWFRLAAASGSKEAAEAVARMEAELSASKLEEAKLTLAEMLSVGQQVHRDLTFALSVTREVADRGNPDAQFRVGRMYAEGIGTEQNAAAALRYLTAAGTPTALNYMADMYLEGRGVTREPKKTVELLEKAAVFSPEPRLRIARMYWNGEGVPQDYKKAMKQYELAGFAGKATAFYQCSIAYRDGLGVKKNDGTACMFLVLAANRGSKEALGVLQQECPGEKLETAKKKALQYMGEHYERLRVARRPPWER
ncbi:MAG TPA: tetratricopeptide repeat protein [Terriglobales bacterium]|nr:tetratricopeptide repeat protein [Terriglobales bacterium]